MTLRSFTDPNTVYQTTSDSCTCNDFYYRSNSQRGYEPGYQCKHMRALAGTPRTVTEARQARILRNRLVARETCNSYMRMMYEQY